MPLIPALATLFLVSVPAAQEAQSGPEAQILQLEKLWNEAHLAGDMEVLDRLWAAEMTVVVPAMARFTKPDLLEMWRSVKVRFSRYETTEVRVQCFGDTAVVTGRLQRSRDFGGQARSEDWLFTKTYAMIDGAWKVVSFHASVRPES